MTMNAAPVPFCWLDGQATTAPSDPTMPLADWLRDEQDWGVVHRGCDSGHCGTCAVRVDGIAVKSCTLMAGETAGCRVVTANALPDEGSAVAEAVLDEIRKPAVLQCGFCESAFLFAAIELLEHDDEPDEEAVRRAFDGLLCRCTGYQRLVEAVMAAAVTLRVGRSRVIPQPQCAKGLDVLVSSTSMGRSPRLHRPATLEAARDLLAQRPQLRWLAGGQQTTAERRADEGAVEWASLQGIAALKRIAREGDTLVVGAACTHHDLARAALVRSLLPALSALASGIGDAFVRNRGTVGGALFDRTPGACYPAALIALDAVIRTSKGDVDARQWFQAPEPDVLVEAVLIPLPEFATHQCLRPVPGRYALISVFASVRAGRLRIGVSGQGAVPYRSRVAEEWLANPAKPPESLHWECETLSDFRAPTVYRVAIAGVLIHRTRNSFLASAQAAAIIQPSS